MDSKAGISPESHADVAPPPYSEGAFSPRGSSISPFASEIQSHLSSLKPILTSDSYTTLPTTPHLQTTRDLHIEDAYILNHIVPEITAYLTSFATFGRATRGTLVLLPYSAISEEEKAVPCIFDHHKKDDFNQVIRVKDVRKTRPDNLLVSLWWKDEAMAKRLAQALVPESRKKPRKESVPTSLPPIMETQVRPNLETSQKGFWRKLSVGTQSASNLRERTSVATPQQPVAEKEEADKHGVTMTTTAEETLFRTENDFGIYGTTTGWCIVLRIKVDRPTTEATYAQGC